MENEIMQLLSETSELKSGGNQEQIDSICNRIEELNKCETIKKIIIAGQYVNYSKLVSFRRIKLNLKPFDAA